MRKENSDFSTKFISEAGSYLINADYFAFVELKDYACYVIADGIDPDEKKESAKLAVTTVITEFSESPGMSAGKLNRFLKAAHETLLRESEEIRLEASIVVLLTDYKKAIWGHAGNSRLCWIRNGEIKTVTKDTSLTQRMADEEEIPIDQIAAHEERNNLYTYLGQPGRFNPVISAKKKLEDGDIFVMMTRGVWENVGDAELIDAVDGVSKAEEVCTGLEDVILSQRLEIIENYTIASVFINKIYQNPKAGRNKKILKIVFTICFALTMLCVSLGVMKYSKNKSTLNKIEKNKDLGIEKMQKMKYPDAQKYIMEAYEDAEGLKARKNSKTYKKVQTVKLYNDMIESIVDGLIQLDKAEYKKATELFNGANENMDTLAETYGEDISSYEKGIRAYQQYSREMYDGVRSLTSNDGKSAISSFQDAKEVMDDVNDTDRRDVAMKAIDLALALDYVVSAEEKVSQANDELKNKNYLVAATLYDSAKTDYENADRLGNVSAAEKAKKAGEDAETARRLNDSESADEKRASANELYSKGYEKAQNGKNAEAAADLEMALNKLAGLNETEDESLRQMVRDLLNTVKEDPAKDLMDAISYLADDKYSLAAQSLNKAADSYDRLGDGTKASQLRDFARRVSSKQIVQ